MKIDILEIQKEIEERRQILAKKIENFLLKNIGKSLDFARDLLGGKHAVLAISLAIIFTSIFAASNRDIGYFSAFYLDNYNIFTQKINTFAKFSGLHAVIIAQVLVNLLGILSIFCSAKILKNSPIYQNKTLYKLVVASFGAGYFLRIFTLQYYEYFTPSSLLIAFSYPYFSYYFQKSFFKKIGFWISSLFFISGILLFKQAPNPLFEALNNFSYFQIAKEDFFALAILIIFGLFFIKDKSALKLLAPLLVLFFVGALLLFFALNRDYQQRSLFYSFALPLIVATLFFLFKSRKINLAKDGVFIAGILFVPQFDPQNFFAIALNLSAFWWILVLINLIKKQQLADNQFFDVFFVPRDASSWFHYVALIVVTTNLFFVDKTGEIAWSVSALVMVILLIFYEKKYQKFIASNYFSRSSAIAIFLAVSYLFSLFLAAIFNLNFYSAYDYKTPNYISEKEVSVINKYAAAKDDKVLIINDKITDIYPVFYYLNKFRSSSSQDQGSPDLPRNAKIILIAFDNIKNCRISFLESKLRDQDFRKFFLKNYKYVTNFSEIHDRKKSVLFYEDKLLEALNKDSQIITRTYEVYVRN